MQQHNRNEEADFDFSRAASSGRPSMQRGWQVTAVDRSWVSSLSVKPNTEFPRRDAGRTDRKKEKLFYFVWGKSENSESEFLPETRFLFCLWFKGFDPSTEVTVFTELRQIHCMSQLEVQFVCQVVLIKMDLSLCEDDLALSFVLCTFAAIKQKQWNKKVSEQLLPYSEVSAETGCWVMWRHTETL